MEEQIKDGKLLLKVQKSYAPSTAVLRVPPNIADRVREIAKETNNDLTTVTCELLEFALDRVQIVE
ncbi:hypothetical protein [Peptoniphilus sp.]|jgi:hypothetical protein|uniref:hypothetical protein n=1 Tax=Peptoniphilus sp. TaxID=1971214 RepID=UPI003D94DB7C